MVKQRHCRLAVGADLDCYKNNASSPCIPALLGHFRQPVQPNSVYCRRWLDIARFARQRGETNTDDLGHIDGFVRQFAA